MRKANREIKDTGELLAVLDKCDACRVALADGDTPYIVPMNFGYEYADGRLTLFFHGASQGKKLEIIAKNPKACFEVDCSHEFLPADLACDCSMNYESVIGNGSISVCEGREEKIFGLSCIMKQYNPGKSYDFPEPMLRVTTVLKLRVTDFTGKRLKRR